MTPGRYQANGTISSAPTKTIVALTGGTTVRPAIYDVILSSNATPADNSSEWQIRRSTVAGTGGSAVTPAPLDSQDPASTTTAINGPSAEPTYTAGAVLLDFAVNQRATFRWVAAPGSELLVPATAAAGLGLQCQGVGGSGAVCIATVYFME